MAKGSAKEKRTLFIKQYLQLFIPAVLFISVMIFLVFAHDIRTEITLLKSEELAAVKLKKSIIENELSRIKSDIKILAESNELQEFCEEGKVESLNELGKELISFLENRKVYDKIRIFDPGGSELIRINYANNNALFITADKFFEQDEKAHFEDIQQLEKNEIFISPMDLSIDKNEIVVPYRPVLKVAIPIFGEDEIKDCSIVLTFNAEHIFHLLGEKFFQYGKEIVLLNSDGYFLKAIYPDEEWGFAFKDKQHITFGNKFPEIWGNIKENISGQLADEYGIFSYNTINPAASLAFPDMKISKTTDLYHWKLISIIPHSIIKDLSSSLFNRLILLNIILAIVIAIVSFFVAGLRVKNILAAKQIENHLNELTILNNKLVDSEKLLIEKNENKDRFISILSHDLKNPLGTLRNFSTMLKDDYQEMEEEDKRSFIDSINNIAENTLNLLLTLLDWSRINLGSIKYRPEKFNLNKLVEENFEMIKYQALDKNISLETDIENSINVSTDKNMLNTLLRNFLSNAVKFTNQNGKIKISAKDLDGEVRVCISDDGVGMTEEQVKKLFEKNEKFTTKGTAQEVGTGLGLQLCRELIEKLHGKLIVRSFPGRGSSFCFYIKSN